MWQEKNDSLYKRFVFKNFKKAFEFMENVAKVAEDLQHHPKWTNEYNTVEIWLSTHEAGDTVTEKDNKLAKKIDNLLVQPKSSNSGPRLESAKLFTDGGSRGNPGPSAAGVVILDMEDNVVKKASKYIGQTTNNQAEYLALKQGLEEALQIGIKNLEVYMDSELVIKQMRGEYKVKNPDLKPVYDDVIAKTEGFDSISFTHVPRELNKIADGLVNECLDNQ